MYKKFFFLYLTCFFSSSLCLLLMNPTFLSRFQVISRLRWWVRCACKVDRQRILMELDVFSSTILVHRYVVKEFGKLFLQGADVVNEYERQLYGRKVVKESEKTFGGMAGMLDIMHGIEVFKTSRRNFWIWCVKCSRETKEQIIHFRELQV